MSDEMVTPDEDTIVCGDGFPKEACILPPFHQGMPHHRIPVVTTGELVATGIDVVTYGDVVNGKTRYVTPEELEMEG